MNNICGYNKTEIVRMRRSLNKVRKCNGNCHDCEHLQIPCKTIDEHHTAYCFYCDVDKDIQPYSDTMKNLKNETIEALEFELQ